MVRPERRSKRQLAARGRCPGADLQRRPTVDVSGTVLVTLSCRVARCDGVLRLYKRELRSIYRAKKLVRRQLNLLEGVARFALRAGRTAKLRVRLRPLAAHELANAKALMLFEKTTERGVPNRSYSRLLVVKRQARVPQAKRE